MLEIIFNLAVTTALLITIGIVFLLFEELGVFKKVNKKIEENPGFKKFVFIFGDTLYGIGISVVGSVLFAFSGMNIVNLKLFLGIAFIITGAFIKR